MLNARGNIDNGSLPSKCSLHPRNPPNAIRHSCRRVPFVMLNADSVRKVDGLTHRITLLLPDVPSNSFSSHRLPKLPQNSILPQS